MKRPWLQYGWLLPCLILFLLTCRSSAAEPEQQFDITNLNPDEGGFVFDYETGIATGTNGVRVVFGDLMLTADSVQLDERTGNVIAKGEVTLRRKSQLWRGDELQFNFKTESVSSEAFKAGMRPFYASGKALMGDSAGNVYTATDVVITTDDAATPSHKIRAKRFRLVPGKSLEAWEATFYLGPFAVWYMPYIYRSLERHLNNWVLTPGYRSLYGPYLLTRYNWFVSEQLTGGVNIDYRQKRGFAAGPDVFIKSGRWGEAGAGFYYAPDENPGETPAGEPIPGDRSRVKFTYEVSPRTNLTAKAVFSQQSDPYVLRDFFESEHRKNPQPRSFVEVHQSWPDFSLDLLAQPQVNDFFQTVERLPEVRLSGLRQQLGVSPFFYESESSLGYMRFRPGFDGGTNYQAGRGDTFHQFILPLSFLGWLNVTPRVGGRLSHYTATDGDIELDAQNRAVFNTGVEASFKASRVWPGVEQRWLDIKGLRHIIEPSWNYSFVPNPTVRPRDLPQFDREVPSLRLLPIEYPDYNAIDAIDAQNVIRLGLRNKLQTKRESEIDTLLHWALVTDLRLDPEPGQGAFADLFSDMDFRPRRWLTLNSELRYNLDDGHWRIANHTATLIPNSTWSLSLGHRYLRSDPAFGLLSGNNLFFSRVYYRVNENWAFRVSHHFEARDGRFEEQWYTLYRDLRSWTGALTFRLRDNRFAQDDFTIAVSFSLKAFPRFDVGDDQNKPELLVGG